jgi:hypothetical protein
VAEAVLAGRLPAEPAADSERTADGEG